MGLWDRILRGRGKAGEARKAELRGELTKAIELWAEEGESGEVARLLTLRGDAEQDASQRLVYYLQAIQTAPSGGEAHRQARAKRAALVLALAAGGAVSGAGRKDLADAARELEELGESDRAAEAYAILSDTEGQARVLERAGQVERLETLLANEQKKGDLERQRSAAHAEIDTLVATGRRREALAAAERLARTDAHAKERADALVARRAGGPLLRLLVGGRPLNLLLDAEVTIGRTEGSLVVRSAALSRKHLSVARRGAGFVVEDLGSRNGTLLRGMKLAGPIPVEDGLELALGGEVKILVRPSPGDADTVELVVGGETYAAPLGPFTLAGGWHIERGADGWAELVTAPRHAAFAGDLELVPRTTLLVGDAFARARGGDRALEVIGS